MTLAIEVILFLAGIGALLHGKLKFGKGNVVRGAEARLLGALAMAPLPMALTFGIWIAVRARARGVNLEQHVSTLTITVAEFLYILLCLGVIAGSVALIAGMRKSYRRRLKAAEAEEDEDDSPARRKRRRWEEPTERPTPPRTMLVVGGAYACVLGVGLVLGFTGLSRVGGRDAGRPVGVDVAHNNTPVPNEPKPVNDRLDYTVPVLPDVIDIHPAALDEPTSVEFGAKIEAVAVGGDGRFLVLNIPADGKVVIFDCCQAKVRHELTFDENVHIAAGLMKLVVLLPGSDQLQRYDLFSGRREATREYAVADKVTGFAMGSASAGPILLTHQDSAALLDLQKLESVYSITRETRRDIPLTGWSRCWASPTGSAFGMTRYDLSPGGIQTLRLGNGRATHKSVHRSALYVIPSRDGKYLFAGGHGALTSEGKETDDVVMSRVEEESGMTKCLLPAHHGPYYVHLSLTPGR